MLRRCTNLKAKGLHKMQTYVYDDQADADRFVTTVMRATA